jgi:hypothetical protein
MVAQVRLISVRFKMRKSFTAWMLLLFTTSCASSFHCKEPFPVTVPIAFHWGCPTVQKPLLATPMNTSITTQANGNVSVLFDGNLDLQQQTSKLTGTVAAFLDFPITTNATKAVDVRCQVRGSVDKSETASVNIFVDIGGHATLLDFPSGAAVNQQIVKEIPMTISAVQPQTWGLAVVITATRPDTTASVQATIEDVSCALANP